MFILHWGDLGVSVAVAGAATARPRQWAGDHDVASTRRAETVCVHRAAMEDDALRRHRGERKTKMNLTGGCRGRLGVTEGGLRGRGGGGQWCPPRGGGGGGGNGGAPLARL